MLSNVTTVLILGYKTDLEALKPTIKREGDVSYLPFDVVPYDGYHCIIGAIASQGQEPAAINPSLTEKTSQSPKIASAREVVGRKWSPVLYAVSTDPDDDDIVDFYMEASNWDSDDEDY
jgi:hypothetical protein